MTHKDKGGRGGKRETVRGRESERDNEGER